MRLFYFHLLLLCLFSLEPKLSAQEKKDSLISLSKEDSLLIESIPVGLHTKSHLTAGFSYLSNNIYMGRKDSSVIPYFTPSLGYYHKSGIFLCASLGYFYNSGSGRIDVVTLGGGYNFSAGDYYGALSLSQFFYNSQSTNVEAEVKESLSYDNAYDLGFITTRLGALLNIGSKTDFAASFGLEHEFSLFDDKVDISPGFTANASTQNYYNDYYKKRRFSIRRKNKAPLTVLSINGEVLNAADFKLLDYEAAIPINYRLGRFTFNATPTYAIPVHPAMVKITTQLFNGSTRTRVQSEKIENSFYISAAVLYRFGK